MFTDILMVRPTWCDAILYEGKVWEVRGHATKKRGVIGLAKTGTSKVFGECEIVDCIPLTKEMYRDNSLKHCVPLSWEELIRVYPTPYAWVLSEEGSKPYEEPIPFNYPKGAVIWVKYEEIK